MSEQLVWTCSDCGAVGPDTEPMFDGAEPVCDDCIERSCLAIGGPEFLAFVNRVDDVLNGGTGR